MDETFNQVMRNISQYKLLQSGDKVIVGVSGGADSMCLLDILARMSAILGIDIKAVHVNHMLRGDEADRDQRYVENYCADNRIPFECISTDIKRISKEMKLSEEETGRNERYRILRSVAKCVAIEIEAETRAAQTQACAAHI